MAVVAFADDCVGQRVENPRPPHAGSLVKISRVLFKKRRQDGAADERAGHGVGVRCAEAFSVALGALPVSAERVRSLLDRKSTRLNSSHMSISYAVFCLKKKKN